MRTVGEFAWKESNPIFARRGVVGHGVRNAAQAARIPTCHIVEEVPSRLGVAGFEDLLPAYGEPLGAPVRLIFEQACPYVGLFMLVIVDEVRA